MDIDIDLRPDFDPDKFFNVTHASMEEDGKLRKHQAGVYFQGIPIDADTSLSAIPYKQSEDMGYTKIDLLHLSLLKDFDSKEQMRELIDREPDWSLLNNEKICTLDSDEGRIQGIIHVRSRVPRVADGARQERLRLHGHLPGSHEELPVGQPARPWP